MAQIVLNIPDAQAPAALDAACFALGYRNTLEPTPGNVIPNPETKAQFIKRYLGEHLKALVIKGAREQAAAAAASSAQGAVEGIAIT